ncbi:hypothetical protein ACPDHQ_16915 [Myroides odoratimimus]|uniref:hypothetical protein n=1 Tax=Myroides odoratimimus TaxID=76832 RepID=UPI003D2F7F51
MNIGVFKSRYVNGLDTRFKLVNNSVLFFSLDKDTSLSNFFNSDYNALFGYFKTKGFNFIYLPKTPFPKSLESLLSFYLPYIPQERLKKIDFSYDALLQIFSSIYQENDSSYIKYYRDFLLAIEYDSEIKNGLILFRNDTYYILELINNEPNHNFNVIDSYFNALYIEDADIFESPRDLNEMTCFLDLDDITKQKIQEIQKQLKALKVSGQLIYALPIIKSLLGEYYIDFNEQKNNQILITSDYRIILPAFNHLEINLSHLTKVIYIFFLNHPEGIDIKELKLYEKELMDLYLNISNQLDYNKMKQTIEDLIHPDSKAIYPHISRIKSTFYSLMDEQFADRFIVTSGNYGSSIKYIKAILPIQLI